jgi:hypothetical protein
MLGLPLRWRCQLLLALFTAYSHHALPVAGQSGEIPADCPWQPAGPANGRVTYSRSSAMPAAPQATGAALGPSGVAQGRTAQCARLSCQRQRAAACRKAGSWSAVCCSSACFVRQSPPPPRAPHMHYSSHTRAHAHTHNTSMHARAHTHNTRAHTRCFPCHLVLLSAICCARGFHRTDGAGGLLAFKNSDGERAHPHEEFWKQCVPAVLSTPPPRPLRPRPDPYL